MYKEKLSNVNYSEFSENIQKGLEYLKNADWKALKDGRYEIDGDNIYINIQTYQTKPDADFEAHRKYIDIQYIISGEEKIGVVDYLACTTSIPYNEVNDIEFLKGSGKYYNLKKGEIMILNPEDAHKPSISVDLDKPKKVRKAVVKVLK